MQPYTSTITYIYEQPSQVLGNWFFSFLNLYQGTSSLHVYKELRLWGTYFHGPDEFLISGFYCTLYACFLFQICSCCPADRPSLLWGAWGATFQIYTSRLPRVMDLGRLIVLDPSYLVHFSYRKFSCRISNFTPEFISPRIRRKGKCLLVARYVKMAISI